MQWTVSPRHTPPCRPANERHRPRKCPFAKTRGHVREHRRGIALLRRGRLESELDEEIRSHLEPGGRRGRQPARRTARIWPSDFNPGSRRRIWLLMASVIGLLLIACLNLANTQLARAVSRCPRARSLRRPGGAAVALAVGHDVGESAIDAAGRSQRDTAFCRSFHRLRHRRPDTPYPVLACDAHRCTRALELVALRPRRSSLK